MLCPDCQKAMRRFGKNRNGSQRFRCNACKKTFTDEATRPPDGRVIPHEKVMGCLRMLLEGNSVRSVERLTGVGRDKIIEAMVEAGQKCEVFMEKVINHVPVEDVEVDELWSFVGCKEKTRAANGYSEMFGDAWCFLGIERTTKMILAWHLGKRTGEDTYAFAAKLSRATAGRFQMTTDGFASYKSVIPATFAGRVDYATLVKVYRTEEDDRRYSPAKIVDVEKKIKMGSPDEDRICTSFVERSNRQIRMQVRRLTRLVDAHSKKWENHEAALALFFAYFNFCRVHMTLATTPAVATGFAVRPWTLEELLDQATPAD
jgi:transposase-like protein/IS1 family transposase